MRAVVSHAFGLPAEQVRVLCPFVGGAFGSKVREARVALGGVAAEPWRAFAAGRQLVEERLDDATLRRAGEAAFEGARPLSQNAFKVELGIRVVGEALKVAAGKA